MKYNNKNKAFTLIELLAVIVILGIILAIAVPSVVGIIEKSRNDAWERQKGIIENTLDSYLLQNQSDIPWQDNKVIYSLEDLTDMGIVDKKITVPRNYQTDEVTIEIIKDDKGKFIYDISLPDELRRYLDTTYKNGAHFFVGANPNNWIEFGQVSSSNATPILWRIVKYDNEGIKIIYEGTKNGSNPPSEDGKIFEIPWADWTIPDPNKWDKSSDLKGLLYDWYENFYAVNKEKLVKPVKWCIGAVEEKTDIVKLDEFLANECSDGTYDGGFFRGKTEYEIGVGLIRPSDYISTSSSENCVNAHNSECGLLPDGTITNFLYKNDYWWYSLNAVANNDEDIWGFVDGIWPLETDASYATRPVINLNPNVLHAGGNGTLTNPYKIK